MDTKQKILSVALELFSQKGYLGTSMSDIAEKLKITKGALYKHYESKQDIFDSILERIYENDRLNAEKYNLSISDDYTKVTLESLCEFSLNQFRYWTENGFASQFRKLLTIEQHRSSEMQKLYQQHLASGQLNYVENIFIALKMQDAKQKALEFFSPLFLSYHLTENGNQKEVFEMLKTHFNDFIKNNK